MGLFGIGKDLARVLARGEPRSGRIVGIRVAMTHDDPPKRVDDYAIAADDGAVLGLRQRLDPDVLVRLGMHVRTRLDGDTCAIDWAETVPSGRNVTEGWKRLKQPPADGILDETLGLDRARKKDLAARVTIDAAEQRAVLLGLGSALHLRVTVRLASDPEPYGAELKAEVPFYAAHLAVPGTELAAWVRERRLDRITLDWPQAAEARPGVGEPPALVAAPEPAETVSATSSGDISFEPDPSAFTPVDGVDFDTYVAVEVGLIRDRVAPDEYDEYAQRHGVAAGHWAAVAHAWQQRIRSDWKLGAAYGEAFEAARRG